MKPVYMYKEVEVCDITKVYQKSDISGYHHFFLTCLKSVDKM